MFAVVSLWLEFPSIRKGLLWYNTIRGNDFTCMVYNTHIYLCISTHIFIHKIEDMLFAPPTKPSATIQPSGMCIFHFPTLPPAVAMPDNTINGGHQCAINFGKFSTSNSNLYVSSPPPTTRGNKGTSATTQWQMTQI